MKRTDEKLNSILALLPSSIAGEILSLCSTQSGSVTELRLRCGQPISVSFAAKTLQLEEMADELFVQTILDKLSGCSMHAVMDRLAEGSFSYNGCRIGVAGRCTYTQDDAQISDIRSICIRIARQHIGIATQLAEVGDRHLLIAGAPSSGKTTLLRDYIRLLASSKDAKNICVIDEKEELAGTEDEFDLGQSCDVLRGYSKVHGIDVALRCLAAQIICCDEVANEADLAALIRAADGGVRCVFTAHIADADALRSSAIYNSFLQKRDASVAFLCGRDAPGTVAELLHVSRI